MLHIGMFSQPREIRALPDQQARQDLKDLRDQPALKVLLAPQGQQVLLDQPEQQVLLVLMEMMAQMARQVQPDLPDL